MESRDAVVETNFGGKPFVYDMDAYGDGGGGVGGQHNGFSSMY